MRVIVRSMEILADSLMKWLEDGEECLLVDNRSKERLYDESQLLFVTLPLDYNTDMVLFSAVGSFSAGYATAKQQLMGYYVKNKKVFIQTRDCFDPQAWKKAIKGTNLIVTSNALKEKVNEEAKHKLVEIYVNQYPPAELVDRATLSEGVRRDLDSYWMHGAMPKDVVDYVEHFSDFKNFEFPMDDSLLTRYVAGKEDVVSELIAPYLEEDNPNTRYDTQNLKAQVVLGNRIMKVLPTFAPSKRAMCTKKIVDAVNSFGTPERRESIKRLRLKLSFEGKVYDGTIPLDRLNTYHTVYNEIESNRWFNKFYCDGELLDDDVYAENVLEISYSRKVIYRKEEVVS